MALANSTLITVTATYTRLDGRAASGQVFFSSNQVLVNSSSGEIVPPVDFVATLDANGAISIDLPATDDPDYEPQGWTYTVTEDTDGGDRPPFGLSVPADGGSIDLADVAPPGPTESLTADEYTLLSTFTGHRSNADEHIGEGLLSTPALGDLLRHEGADGWQVYRGSTAGEALVWDGSAWVRDSDTYEKALNLVHDVTHPDYGGVADDTTDTTPASQSAADTVAGEGGGIVFYPATTSSYWHSGTVALTSTHKNVAFIGAGQYASEITCAGQWLDGAQDADQTTVSDLHIRCTSDPNTDNGVYANTPRRWAIRRCFLEGFGGDSIHFEAGIHCEIEFNLFKAEDPGGANGHAAVYVRPRQSDGAVPSTLKTEHNYCSAGVQYGFLYESSAQGSHYNDIAEFVDVGFRWASSSGCATDIYTEAISTSDIQRHDSSQLTFINPRGVVETTWSGTAGGDRYPPLLSRDQTVLGKQASAKNLDIVQRLVQGDLVIFADGDTTPSVLTSNNFRTNNSAATSITTFDDGLEGQVINVLVRDGNTTFVDGTTLYLSGGIDYSPIDSTILSFLFDGGAWREISRTEHQ